jgi:hypothetical protein
MFNKKDGKSFPNVTGGTFTAPDSLDADTLEFDITGFVEGSKSYDAKITLTSNGTSTVLELDNSSNLNDAVYVANAKDYSEDSNLSNAIYNKAFIQKTSAKKTEGESEASSSEASSSEGSTEASTAASIEAGYVTFFNNFILNPYDETGTYLKDKDGNTAKVMCDNGTVDGKTINEASDLLSTDIEAYVDFKDHIKINDRVLTIDIDTDKSGNYVVKASMVYHYSIENFSFYTATYPKKVPDAYLADETEDETTSELSTAETASLGEHHYATYPLNPASEDDYLVYKVDNVLEDIYTSKDKPDRLFIYYYPQYDLQKTKDKIVINNTADIDGLSCYIIKQKSASINDTRMANCESKYEPSVTCTTTTGKVYLYHNFDTNIGGKDSITGTAGYEASGFDTSKGGDISKILNTEDESSKDNGFAADEVLSYNIKVEITDTGTSKIVSTLESSKTERISDTKPTESTSTSAEGGD